MRTIPFYVATDYARKSDAARLAEALLSAVPSFVLNARWVTDQPVFVEGGLGGELGPEDAASAARVAEEDLQDIRCSSVFVQLSSGEKSRGGRQVELGYALATQERLAGRAIIVVGPREHAFHYHPAVAHVEDLEQLVAWARGYATGAGL